MSKTAWLAAVVFVAWAGEATAQTVTGQAVSRPDPLTGVRSPVRGIRVEAFDANGRPLGNTVTGMGSGEFSLRLSGNSDEVTLKFSGTDSVGVPRADTSVGSLNPQSSQNLSVVVPTAEEMAGHCPPTLCPTYTVMVTSTPVCCRGGLFHRRR